MEWAWIEMPDKKASRYFGLFLIVYTLSYLLSDSRLIGGWGLSEYIREWFLVITSVALLSGLMIFGSSYFKIKKPKNIIVPLRVYREYLQEITGVGEYGNSLTSFEKLEIMKISHKIIKIMKKL